MSDDLKRDLQLATTSGLDLASQQAASRYPLTEVPISSAPAPATTLRKGSGQKAVRSKHPTVKAAPEPTVVAKAEEPTVDAATPVPTATTEPTPEPSAPAVPRPSPVPTDPNGGEGAHGHAGGGQSTGTSDGGGSIIGTIFGVVIRGGIVDGDHCDPRTDGRRPRRYPPTTFPSNPYPFPMAGGTVMRPRS